jgi:hypothetical protein
MHWTGGLNGNCVIWMAEKAGILMVGVEGGFGG